MATRPSPRQSSAPAALDSEPDEHRLPVLNLDPRAGFWIQSIQVDAFGATWTIRAMSAADWMEAIWADDFTILDIFPGMVEQEDVEDEMYEALFGGEITMEEISRIGLEIIEEASGYDYWVALRAISSFKPAWLQIGGATLRSGIDPARTALGAFITAALSWLVENMKPAKAVQFLEELNKLPEGEESRDEEEDLGAAFLAAMNQSL